MKKRILSVLLCMAMVIAMLPLASIPASAEVSEPYFTTAARYEYISESDPSSVPISSFDQEIDNWDREYTSVITKDFIAIFTVGVGKIVFMTFVGYVVSAGAAFVGTYLAVSLIKVMIQRSDYTAFAYYDFGLALFTFIMYLIT